MTKCIQCGKETTNPKFCNHSCSAKFTNSHREVRSEESKLKTSKAMKGRPQKHAGILKPKYSSIHFITCSNCGKECYRLKRILTCSDICAHEKRIRNGLKSKHLVYNGIKMDSSWEVDIAKWLDYLNINWIRPKPISYWMNNKQRKYYPDFYITNYNLYLDPKNPYGMIKDNSKMNIISSMVDIIYGDIESIKTGLLERI